MNYGLLAPDEREQLSGTALTSGLLSALAGAAGSAGRPWGQVIANSLAGGLQGYQGTFDNAAQARMMQQKLAQQEQEQSMKQQEFAWRKAEAERNAKAPIQVGKSLVDPVTMKPVYTDQTTERSLALTPKIGINPKTNKPEFVQPSASGEWVWSGITPTDNELKIAQFMDETGRAPASYFPQGNTQPQPMQNNASGGVPASPSAIPTSNFTTPYPVTWSGPTATDIAEGTSPDMQLGNPANPNLPAKTQRALTQKQAEAQIDIGKQKVIDQNQADIGVDTENKKEQAKKSRSMAGIGSVIDEARFILTSLNPTSSGLGTAVDKAMGFFGKSTEGSPGAAKLKSLGGNLIMKMPRMEGPQSNLDQELYREMAGRVGDSTVPIPDRVAALEVVESLFRKYDKESSIIPNGAQMPAKKSDMSSGGWSVRKVK